jgi:VWFA-related protein
MRIERRFINPNQFRPRIILALLLLLLTFSPPNFPQSSQPETIRIESDLVDLKVGVTSLDPQHASPELQQKDFVVFEDGQKQEITFFAAADAPFDLVLLLDLSGSTSNKLKLIRKSAKRFVDSTRPIDRVSIVTFTDVAQIVCPLTTDRVLLKKSIDDIEKPMGGTKFWDALYYVLAIFRASGNNLRRRAVVVMTDGVDNALPDVFGEGSRTSFDDLLKFVSTSETIVFPIYLDTEKEEVHRHPGSRLAYAIALNQLAQLAAACGTNAYRASKLEDLDDVYRQVIGDLSRVYSIGYRPSNNLRNGKWRSVSVKIADRRDVVARTKQGYYARSPASE